MKYTFIVILIGITIGCGSKKSITDVPNKDQSKDSIQTTTSDTSNTEENFGYQGYSSKEIEPAKTDTLTLISGWDGIDSKTIDFKTKEGEMLTAWDVPKFIKWKVIDETKEVAGHEEIEEKFLNKKYIVTFSIEKTWYEPGGCYQDIIVIKKMTSAK